MPIHPRLLAEDFFVYLVSIGNLAAAAAAIGNVQIQADADFEWQMTSFFAVEHGAVAGQMLDTVQIPITVQITDSGTSRMLLSAPVPLSMIAGIGRQPFILPVPRIFQSKSNIQVTFLNFGAAAYDYVNLAFIGRKIFDVSRNAI
jgi:hypothetical protein